MDQANILIIGGASSGAPSRTPYRSAGRTCSCREISQAWDGHEHAQQWRESLRNLLPEEFAQGAALCGGQPAHVRILRKAQRAVSPLRETVVAADAHEVEELAALKKRGEDNGVEGLRLIDAAEIRKREPHIRGTAALVVPSTGIVSAEELVHAYARVASNQGANMVTRAEVVSLTPSGKNIRVGLRIGDEEDSQDETIEARCVINAAGLYADEVAAMLGNHSWKIYPVRGNIAKFGGRVRR